MEISPISQIFTNGHVLAFSLGAVYAGILCTPMGMEFDEDVVTRWFVVSVGVLLVWLAAAVTGEPFGLSMFVFAGVPLAMRGMYFGWQRGRENQSAVALRRAFDGD